MKNTLVLVLTLLASLIFIQPMVAFAEVKAMPFSHTNDEVWASNLKEFFETFSVVDSGKDDYSRFQLERKGYRVQNNSSWFIGLKLIPESVEQTHATYFGDGSYEKVVFASFPVTLRFYNSSTAEDSEVETVVRAYVRVNLDYLHSGLAKEHVDALVQSIKNKQTIRIKGELTIYGWGNNLKALKEHLEDVSLLILEINGVPVPPSYQGY